jgi:hypothetical protein
MYSDKILILFTLIICVKQKRPLYYRNGQNCEIERTFLFDI